MAITPLWSGSNLTTTTNGSVTVITNTSPLVLRDLTTDTNTVIAQDADNTRSAVASNGNVVFRRYGGTDNNVWSYDNGTLTNRSAGAAPFSWNGKPGTDGQNVIYCSSNNQSSSLPASIMLRTADGTTTTLVTYNKDFGASEGYGYDINHGWVAFEKPTSRSDYFEIWTRSPEGDLAYVTTRYIGTNFLNVGADGSVAYRDSDTGKYYLDAPGQTPTVLGAGGIVKWVDDTWYYVTAPEPSLALPLFGAVAGLARVRRRSDASR